MVALKTKLYPGKVDKVNTQPITNFFQPESPKAKNRLSEIMQQSTVGMTPSQREERQSLLTEVKSFLIRNKDIVDSE